ncbi:MAG: arylsulfatase [Planctomycetota bacterium]|nr:arylsulfatase [Planctomycetota bacterium]
MSNHAKIIATLLPVLLFSISSNPLRAADRKPNVVLVITDDQGYGDVAAHGNKMIQTPNIDRLHSISVRLTDFHVDPTCSPTRSALMSGRYSTRTGVWHTIMGRSIMSSSELTIAEVFKAAGYTTGMYGKWHLGDNYPCRPQDQGFDETFYHGGGGVGQTPDYFGNDYFDDTYFRNGKPEKAQGYCTDVWFREALSFIEKNREKPFFAYLSTNAPHGPFLVADSYKVPYQKKGVQGSMVPFYGMITNIDENMGKLMKRLDELKLAENTILIFMTDNGTAAGAPRGRRGKPKPGGAARGWPGFNAGMRGQKGSSYDGGHRVPFFIRWPAGGIKGGRDIETLSAHIDVLPTLVQLCGIKLPEGPPIDGKSLAPLLKGEEPAWPDRTLFVHSQRIEQVKKGRNNSVMTKRWRLVGNKELYDITADPAQAKNIAANHPGVVKTLNGAYDEWWKSLSPVFTDTVHLVLGNPAENPANLTCHDWHTNNGPVPWNHGHIRKGPVANGFWAVNFEKAGQYEITLRRWPEQEKKKIGAVKARIRIGPLEKSQDVNPEENGSIFKLEVPAGKARLQTWLQRTDGKTCGAYFVEIRRVD